MASLFGPSATNPPTTSAKEATMQPPVNEAVQSPYLAAAENIRTAARWLLTAFAAVGGVLIAGVPLTAIGRIDPWSINFLAAAVGVGVALLAIAYMIYLVSRVFTAEFVSFAEFSVADLPGTASRRRIRTIRSIATTAERSRFELYGPVAADLGQLHERLTDLNEQVLKGSKSRGASVSPELLERAEAVTAAAARVTDFVNYEFVRRTFRSLFPRLAACGAVVALGVGVYVLNTGQAPPKDPSVTKPVAVRLALEQPSDELRDALGEGCDVADIPAVAVGGTLDEPEVVTARAEGCLPVRVDLRETTGIAVPVIRPTSGG